MSNLTLLSDLGFEISRSANSSFLFEVTYREEYWGSISIRGSVLETLNRESILMDIWYGRKKGVWS